MPKSVRGIPPNEGREYPKWKRRTGRQVEETSKIGQARTQEEPVFQMVILRRKG
jgi:hypothetical protein